MATNKRLTGRLAALATTAVVAALLVPAAAPAQTPPTCDSQGPSGTAYVPGVNCRTVTLDGHQRRYKVYVPTLPAGQRTAVVYMFHGGSGDGEQFLNMSGWREKSDSTGMVSVFPTAMRYRIIANGAMSTRWNSFKISNPLQTEIDTTVLPPGSAIGSPVPADDVGFVDHMTSDLRALLPIDRHRVYASGFSNGAAFTARLAVDRSDKIAAVAYSGGGMPDVYAPTRSVPTYRTIGTIDPNVLAATNPLLTELPLDPIGILTNSTLDPLFDNLLATLDLDAGDFSSLSEPHSTTLRWPPRGSASNGGVFTFGMIGGLSHMYPKAGNNDAGFAAASEFWNFFQNHRLP